MSHRRGFLAFLRVRSMLKQTVGNAETSHASAKYIIYDILKYIANSIVFMRQLERVRSHAFIALQGTPRGLLMYYVLHKLSLKPVYGYEILKDIESKSEGVWRPGPSSIYPLLKKLERAGFIRAQGKEGDGTSHKFYTITQKGREQLLELKKKFSQASQKWDSIPKIFVELVEPEDALRMVEKLSTSKFELLRELVESKLHDLPKREVAYALEQYRLSLKRQLDWVNELLSKLGE